MSEEVMCLRSPDTPGVPPRPLPIWAVDHLGNKLYVPTIVPHGAVAMYYGLMGDSPWRTFNKLDFDIDDPLNFKLPQPQEYNALTDPHLREFFFRPDVARLMYKRGFITKDGKVLCQLREYNRFRQYLHLHNTRVVRTIEKEREPEYVKDMMFSTVGHMTKHMRELARENKDPDMHRVRYSAVLSNESQRVWKYCEDAFRNIKALDRLNEGEWKHLQRVKNMMQEECRKIALIRLRRLQDYDEKHHRGLNNWRTRKIGQIMMLAENEQREQVLEYERLKHIRDYINYITCKWNSMDDTIKQYARERYAQMQCTGHKIARYICIKMHRQWPISARCPHRVLEGETVKDCNAPLPTCTAQDGFPDVPFDYTYFADLEALSPAWKCPPHQFRVYIPRIRLRRPHGTDLWHGVSKENFNKGDDECKTRMIHHIIRNAVEIALKYTKTPDGQKRISSAPSVHCHYSEEVEARYSNSETFNNDRKAQWLYRMMSREVGTEVQSLVKQPAEILLLVSDTLDYSVQNYKDEEWEEADWDSAPLLKTSSHSDTGKYVRESLAVVSKELEKDNLLANEQVVLVRELISDAMTDVTMTSTIKDIEEKYSEGPEMLGLAESMIKQAMTSCGRKKKYSECESKRMSAGVVTTLVRSVLHRLKKSIINKALTEQDLHHVLTMLHSDGVCSFDNEGQAGEDQEQGGVVADKVAACSDKLMQSDSITRLITRTVTRVAKKRNASEDQIKTHISNAAKQFITRVIDSIFNDYDYNCEQQHDENHNHNNPQAQRGSGNISGNNRVDMKGDAAVMERVESIVLRNWNKMIDEKEEKVKDKIELKGKPVKFPVLKKSDLHSRAADDELNRRKTALENRTKRFTPRKKSPTSVALPPKSPAYGDGRKTVSQSGLPFRIESVTPSKLRPSCRSVTDCDKRLKPLKSITNEAVLKIKNLYKDIDKGESPRKHSNDSESEKKSASVGKGIKKASQIKKKSNRGLNNNHSMSGETAAVSVKPAVLSHSAASGRIYAHRDDDRIGAESSNGGGRRLNLYRPVSPRFREKPIKVDYESFNNSLAVISVKKDRDLSSPDSISERNSFRNLLKPDLDQVSRFNKASYLDEAALKMTSYQGQPKGQTRKLSYADKLLMAMENKPIAPEQHKSATEERKLTPPPFLPMLSMDIKLSTDNYAKDPKQKSYVDKLLEQSQINHRKSRMEKAKKSKSTVETGGARSKENNVANERRTTKEELVLLKAKKRDMAINTAIKQMIDKQGDSLGMKSAGKGQPTDKKPQPSPRKTEYNGKSNKKRSDIPSPKKSGEIQTKSNFDIGAVANSVEKAKVKTPREKKEVIKVVTKEQKDCKKDLADIIASNDDTGLKLESASLMLSPEPQVEPRPSPNSSEGKMSPSIHSDTSRSKYSEKNQSDTSRTSSRTSSERYSKRSSNSDTTTHSSSDTSSNTKRNKGTISGVGKDTSTSSDTESQSDTNSDRDSDTRSETGSDTSSTVDEYELVDSAIRAVIDDELGNGSSGNASSGKKK